MQEVADRIGIVRDTLTRQINGNPTVETLEKIANALEVDISELFAPKKKEKETIGFIKIDGVIHEIKSFDDLKNLLEKK